MRVAFEEIEIGGITKRTIRVLLPFYLISAASYLAWRSLTVLQWHIWYAVPLLLAEIVSISLTVSYLLTARKILRPLPQPPLEGAVVDIFITTYNEPEEIIKMTALGALNVRGVRQVFVLDDGNRTNVKVLADALGARYVARDNNQHAKAGNMNNGIKYSDAEYIVFLDCDHVPQANFIERTSGYFRDETLAFVQTPQLFYNGDSIQFRKTHRRNFWNEQSMFYESIQPAKNAYNAAFFCGSGSMLRRAAIDSVDGFATGTATEDIHTSLRLHAKGWTSVFLSEQLAHGIAAENLNEYHKQRVRWGAGSLGLLFRSPDSPLRARGLTFMQRVCYINSTVASLNGLQRLFYILLPAGVLIFLPLEQNLPNIPAVKYTTVALPFIVLSYFVTYIFSRRTFHPIYTEQFNIANIFPNIMATKGIFNVDKKFKVSLKVSGSKQESAAYRVLLGFFAITLLAALAGPFYWFFYYGNNSSGLLKSIVGVSIFWNIINMYFVGSVLWFVNFHNERHRSQHQLAANIPVRISGHNFGDVRLLRISLRGAELASPKAIAKENVGIFLSPAAAKALKVKARVISSEQQRDGSYVTGVEFRKLKLSEDISLTKYMFQDIVPGVFKDEFIRARTLQAGDSTGKPELPPNTYAEQEA